MKTAAVVILFVIAYLNRCVSSEKPGKSPCNLDVNEGRSCDDEYCGDDDDDDYCYDDGEDRWYFDYKTKICRLFYYKGCGGNSNNFMTKENCKDKCNALPTCQQPQEGGRCRGYFPRFYYNPKTGKCQRFIYGGCGGNDNNFKTVEECNEACCKKAPVPTCEQPKEVGPCEALIPRFYYCPQTGECEPFDYGGCQGNQNNFETKEACEEACKTTLPTCQQPRVVGPCKGAFPRFYYNTKSGECEEFIYGGCGGNKNNFETVEECEETCCEKALPTCQQPRVVGPCKGAFPRFYYNPKSGKCEEFIYGGCGGNKNNFKTVEECEESCCEKTLPTCQQPRVVGPCKGSFPRFYYNPKSGKCEEFIYGGCGGNKNNFETVEECEETCCEKARVPTCKQPKVVGPCKARIRRYFFNTETGKCEQFYYGGCKGNENNFETSRACETKCKKGFCPRKKNPEMNCFRAQHQCCRDTQCRGDEICCNENCGNVCRCAAATACDQSGTRVFDDPECEISRE